MPYTEKQIKLFQAAAHNPAIAKSSGIPMTTAKKMAAEGVKGKKKNKLAELARG